MDAAKYWPEVKSIDTDATEQLSNQILDLRNEITNLKNTLSTLQEITSITQKDDTNYIELTNLPSDLTGKNPPISIRLPDGTLKDISTWRDILLESCTFVLTTNPSIPIPLTDAAGKKINLFDTKPPGKGIALHKFEYKGKEIYIYANYTDNRCVINAMYVLKYVDPAKVKFKVSVRFGENIATTH